MAPTPSVRYTSHEPPNPMVTLPASTMTGTWRRPLESLSMRARAWSSSRTLKYSWGVLQRPRRRPSPCAHAQALQRSEEHTSELQSHHDLVCRLLLENNKCTQ